MIGFVTPWILWYLVCGNFLAKYAFCDTSCKMKDKCVSVDTNVPDSPVFDLCNITGRIHNTLFTKEVVSFLCQEAIDCKMKLKGQITNLTGGNERKSFVILLIFVLIIYWVYYEFPFLSIVSQKEEIK